MRRLLSLAGLLPLLALGQSNLQFQEGAVGQLPPGWFILEAVKDSGYSATAQRAGCRTESMACVVLTAPASPAANSFGTLMQSIDAAPFRGKTVRLRAWIRMEGRSPEDYAQMLLHVGRPGAQQGFVDHMVDRPITASEWKQYEIQGEVAPDADNIRIAVTLHGRGHAWVSEVAFGAAPEETAGPSVDAVRVVLQKQYARVDGAFVRGDVELIRSILMPEAQMGVGTIREPLLPAIEGEIAKGARLTTRTVVSAVRLEGDEAIAMVQREARDAASNGSRSAVTTHRDRWIQTANGWRWLESIEISYHWILPPTGAAASRAVSTELKARAVRGLDDLSSFGAAVGSLRLVALGEAARGTLEFPQVKRRMVEYLVREKGFRVVAGAPGDSVAKSVAEGLGAEFAAFDSATVAALVNVTYPQAKIVIWTDNAHARELREKFGRRIYAVGFAFRRGAVRAIGVEAGESRGLNTYSAAGSPEGSGDAVLSGAGMPQFFLNMAALPGGGSLARWLGEVHLFHDLGAYWVIDDPDASLQPLELSKCYDGLFFVEELHGGG